LAAAGWPSPRRGSSHAGRFDDRFSYFEHGSSNSNNKGAVPAIGDSSRHPAASAAKAKKDLNRSPSPGLADGVVAAAAPGMGRAARVVAKDQAGIMEKMTRLCSLDMARNRKMGAETKDPLRKTGASLAAASKPSGGGCGCTPLPQQTIRPLFLDGKRSGTAAAEPLAMSGLDRARDLDSARRGVDFTKSDAENQRTGEKKSPEPARSETPLSALFHPSR
jgi:hypothetical protein